MAWDNELSEEQKAAVCHFGGHARLLAGPGTGKTRTLTQHIRFLVEEKEVSPEKIRVISFTRATAGELHQRINKVLSENQAPMVSTLHSFALSELLTKAANVRDIIFPLRIADDWEESNIIYNDIKDMIDVNKDYVANLFKLLAADWETLKSEEEDWEIQLHSRNPQFIGAWQEHRRIYGYTLTSEIVYQLKKAIDQSGSTRFKRDFDHIVVDEYQDFNKCDLSIFNHLAETGAELYIAGDDDQSIYGFRRAHPEGIRQFHLEYEGSIDYKLSVCRRCSKKILSLGMFVAKQDLERIDKDLQAHPNCQEGVVKILRFANHNEEASEIANLCSSLIKFKGLKPKDILILLKSDKNNAFSEIITKKLIDIGISAIKLENQKLNDLNTRSLLNFLRLFLNRYDSLSWRTLLSEWCSRIGSQSIALIYNAARDNICTFAEAIHKIIDNSVELDSSHTATHLIKEIFRINDILDCISIKIEAFQSSTNSASVSNIEPIVYVLLAAEELEFDDETYYDVITFFLSIIDKKELKSLDDLIKYATADFSDPEEILDSDSVNILTMHKAKGLEARAVFIVAAEDEHIPYQKDPNSVSEDRRLMYVSLTRAEEYLYITFCNNRWSKKQSTLASNDNPELANKTSRTLTRFLQNSTFRPESGKNYAKKFGGK